MSSLRGEFRSVRTPRPGEGPVPFTFAGVKLHAYKYTFVLALIPVFAWAAWPSKPKQVELVPTKVHSEGWLEQRQDEGTFRRRWSPVSEMPPSAFIRQIPMAKQPQPKVEPRVEPRVEPPPPSIRRRHRDVCQAHGLRKRHYGKRWRCVR